LLRYQSRVSRRSNSGKLIRSCSPEKPYSWSSYCWSFSTLSRNERGSPPKLVHLAVVGGLCQGHWATGRIPLGDTGDDRWRMVPVAKRPTVKDTRKNQRAGGAHEPWEATRLGERKPRNQTRGRTPREKTKRRNMKWKRK